MSDNCPKCNSSKYFGTLPDGSVTSCFECGYSSIVRERSIPDIETFPAMGQSSGNLLGKDTRFTSNMDSLINAAILSDWTGLKDAAVNAYEAQK